MGRREKVINVFHQSGLTFLVEIHLMMKVALWAYACTVLFLQMSKYITIMSTKFTSTPVTGNFSWKFPFLYNVNKKT